MNWYRNIIASLAKQADPHVMETCPNPHCGSQFVIDLRWEDSNPDSRYRAIDDTGHMYDELTVFDSLKDHRHIVDEWSREKITCPQCRMTWLSKFERKPQQSNYPQEHIINVGAIPQKNYHEPVIIPE